MSKYEIYKEADRIDIFGYDQRFDEEDRKSLWKEHNIFYLRGNVMAVWIEERNNQNPLVHLMQEDDGHIWWDKEEDIRFDSCWLNDYIETLSEVKKLIRK